MPDQKSGKPDAAVADDPKKKGEHLPPAGPHADPRLTNEDATPGSGTMPPIGTSDEPNIQPTS